MNILTYEDEPWRWTSTKVSRLAAAEADWVANAMACGVSDGGSLTRQARERRIRWLAYLKAERRGFAPGHETEDWLEAEREVDHGG